MFIKFTDYEDGIHNIELIENVENLGLEEPFFGDLVFNCKMDKSHNQILLNCNISVNAEFECDRCAENFKKNLTNDFQLTYFISGETNITEDPDVFYLSTDETKIKLTQEVKEYTLLSVSMKKLCREDCKGLCLKCGINLNNDKCDCKQEISNPVWQKLLNKDKD